MRYTYVATKGLNQPLYHVTRPAKCEDRKMLQHRRGIGLLDVLLGRWIIDPMSIYSPSPSLFHSLSNRAISTSILPHTRSSLPQTYSFPNRHVPTFHPSGPKSQVKRRPVLRLRKRVFGGNPVRDSVHDLNDLNG
jgi:hypothetical protein